MEEDSKCKFQNAATDVDRKTERQKDRLTV